MTIVILAAGLSSRMGENKLLLPYKGNTILDSTIEAAKETGCSLILVTGHEKELIEEIAKRHGIRTIFNPDYEKGQKGSSLQGISMTEDDFALLPGDLPLIQPDDILSAFHALDSAPTSRAVHKGTPGHPVAYRKELRDKLLAYPGTMKEFLKEVGTVEVQASLGSVYDVDTREKYQALLGYDGNLSILDVNLN